MAEWMRVDEIEFRTEHPVPFCHPISQPGLSASLLTLGDITILGFFTTFIHKMLFVIAFVTYVIAVNVGPRHGSPAIEQAWPDDSDRILTMNFNEHEDYKNLSHEYDHMWDDLLPLNGGFLRKRYSNGQIHGHGISMFHQLHCLQIMRAAYQEMEEKVEGMRKERREVQEEKPHMHMHLGKGHWLHCFDYLRQAILCNADATVETPSISSKGEPVVDGMIERKCRDWKALWEAAGNSDRISDVL